MSPARQRPTVSFHPRMELEGLFTKALKRRGYVLNHKRAERLMAENRDHRPHRAALREDDLAGQAGACLGCLTLVQGDFSQSRRAEPHIPRRHHLHPEGEGWLYLASVLDLGSRRLAGWEMADHMRDELTCPRECPSVTGLSRRCPISVQTAPLNVSAGSTGPSASAWASPCRPAESAPA